MGERLTKQFASRRVCSRCSIESGITIISIKSAEADMDFGEGGTLFKEISSSTRFMDSLQELSRRTSLKNSLFKNLIGELSPRTLFNNSLWGHP